MKASFFFVWLQCCIHTWRRVSAPVWQAGSKRCQSQMSESKAIPTGCCRARYGLIRASKPERPTPPPTLPPKLLLRLAVLVPVASHNCTATDASPCPDRSSGVPPTDSGHLAPAETKRASGASITQLKLSHRRGTHLLCHRPRRIQPADMR